jgi:hypothetical protein
VTLKIFAMPPVAYVAGLLDREDPVALSVDAATGVEDRSAFGPSRRVFGVTVSALSLDRAGAGYMASLKHLLGGVHFVRLLVPPVNRAGEATFTASGTAGTSGGFATLGFTGLPAGQLVCRAYDVVRSNSGSTVLGIGRAVSTVIANSGGAATIRLHSTVPTGTITIGEAEPVVCRAIDITPGEQQIDGNWTIKASFREALSAEFTGAEEVNPW